MTSLETTEPQLKDDMAVGTIVVLPGPSGSVDVIVQARRTIDGWEVMPSLIVGQVTTEDLVANFDEAYLDNPERMLRLAVPEELGKLRGGVSEEFGFAVEARRHEAGWLLNKAV